MTLSDTQIQTIAAKIPTPFYAYDAENLRDTFAGLKAYMPEGADIYYSLKSNPNHAIIGTLAPLGAGAEVCSLPELHIAMAAGANPRRTIFVGPAKSEADINGAMDFGIKAIVAESLDEVKMINRLAALRGIVQPIALRINPNFKSAKVRIIMTGRASQFGIDEDALPDVLAALDDCPAVVMVGIHVYLGSRVLDEEAIHENTTNILGLATRIGEALGRPLAFVDVGGGFGVKYHTKERDLDVDVLGKGLNEIITGFRAANKRTRVVIELGRYLVARAGVFVTSVRYVKTSKGQPFAVCDGGSNVHAAAAGYGSAFRKNMPMSRVGAVPTDAPTQNYMVTGPLCTPSDTIGDNVEMPELAQGDMIRIDRSGAYGASHSPVNFLSFGHPAEVLMDGEVATLVRAADTIQSLLDKQISQTLPNDDAATTAARKVLENAS
jgi:diaminopimelate decarboxylase